MFYGANIWDPALILSQIVSVQCLSYLTLGLLQWMIISPFHHGHLSLHFLFDWRYLNVHSFTGWLTVAATLINAFVCAAALLFIVGRAKKCLDFSATLYIWHGVFTITKSGVPASVVWWVVTLTNLAITSLLGEWFCLQREMRDIPLNSLRDMRKKAPASAVAPVPVGNSLTSTNRSSQAGTSHSRSASQSLSGHVVATRLNSGVGRESSQKGSRETHALLSDAV
mmetsp:Transcript_1661/g.4314  ORF Transcript_1661/g.4314 Transcript_1661/m.4314 type:complete len:225 (+) Transcript_1661:371-1045(+)